MLLGEHEHTIDDKNRLTLPARIRPHFAGGIVVTRGMDGCLFAYTREDWSHLVDTRLATLDPLRQGTGLKGPQKEPLAGDHRLHVGFLLQEVG